MCWVVSFLIVLKKKRELGKSEGNEEKKKVGQVERWAEWWPVITLTDSLSPTSNYSPPNYDLYCQSVLSYAMEMDGEGAGHCRLIIDWEDSDGLGLGEYREWGGFKGIYVFGVWLVGEGMRGCGRSIDQLPIATLRGSFSLLVHTFLSCQVLIYRTKQIIVHNM